MFSEYDLIQAMSGVDEFGDSKCFVGIKQQRCDADGHLKDVDDEFVTEKPVLKFFRQAGGFITVDMIFQSVEDRDLKIIFSYLDRFFQASNSATDDEMEFPLLSFSFVPHEHQGLYWALGLNPVHYTLTPEDSTGEPRIIRMLFLMQDDKDILPNFLFLRSSDSELAALNTDLDEALEQE